MSGQGLAAEEWNPDLYYRLKLKLWNRDRMTNAVRTPWDRTPPAGADVAHWKMGTRVVITEEGDETVEQLRSQKQHKRRNGHALGERLGFVGHHLPTGDQGHGGGIDQCVLPTDSADALANECSPVP